MSFGGEYSIVNILLEVFVFQFLKNSSFFVSHCGHKFNGEGEDVRLGEAAECVEFASQGVRFADHLCEDIDLLLI